MKRTGKFLLLFLMLGNLAFPTLAFAQDSEMDEYLESIDRSCTLDDDCAIEDVHNCCGYFPECVNKNAQTDPQRVELICSHADMTAVCGYDEIEACECVNSKCEPRKAGALPE